jgi:hypothetical protein
MGDPSCAFPSQSLSCVVYRLSRASVYLLTTHVNALPFVSSFSGHVCLTTPAHWLMTKAYEIGGPSAQSALITPIFHAYYEDDLDISDSEVLADAAVQATIMSKVEVSISPGGPERSSNTSHLEGTPHSKLIWK